MIPLLLVDAFADRPFAGNPAAVCLLARWPDDRWLRQGVRAKGWVLLNEVSLGYELWRQLNGFPPVVALREPEPGAGEGK